MITLRSFTFISIVTFLVLIFVYAPTVAWTFFSAIVIAYILEPSTKFLSKKLKLSHTISSTIILVIFISLLVLLFSMLIPTIYKQIFLLVKKIPIYQRIIQQNIIPDLISKIAEFNPELASNFTVMTSELFSNFDRIIQHYLLIFLNYFVSEVFTMTMLILLPVLLVYFLKDWPLIKNKIFFFLNNANMKDVGFVLNEINDLLTGYIKGTLTVCLILSSYYVICLSISNTEFPLIMGICSGFAILLPIIGPTIAGISALLFDYLANGYTYHFYVIFSIYLIGQSIETYILTPKIVGGKLGLHPLIIIFSVLVGAKVFGIKGVLLAIPTVGILKILLKYIIYSKFKFSSDVRSKFYGEM